MLLRNKARALVGRSLRVSKRALRALVKMDPEKLRPDPEPRPRNLFCVGMIRSCSTWQYNVACELLEGPLGCNRLGFLSGEQFTEWEKANENTKGKVALKYHDPDPSFCMALQENRAMGLYSYRDLRDVFFSVMHKYNASFDVCLEMITKALEKERIWTAQPNMLFQRYEEIVKEPTEAVLAIARHLGIHVRPHEAAKVAGMFSLSANKERTQSLKAKLQDEGVDLARKENKELCDEQTLLHWNHIGLAKTGYWRSIGTHERALIAKVCGEWLIERGYEKDYYWVHQQFGIQYVGGF